MSDADIILANIEQALREGQASSLQRFSIALTIPGHEVYAKALALRGYKTALLTSGRGYRIYAKET